MWTKHMQKEANGLHSPMKSLILSDTNLLNQIRIGKACWDLSEKNFKEGRDFSEVRVGTAKSGCGGHNRLEIQMTKFPFKKMLLKVGTAMSEAIHDCLLFSFSLLYIHKMLFYKRRCFLNRHNQFSELHFSRKFGIPHQNHVSLFQRKTNTTRKIF